MFRRFLVAATLLCLAADQASAQSTLGRKKRNVGAVVQRPRYVPGAAGGNYVGMRTRLDILRQFDGLDERASDRYRGYYRPSPLRQMLDQQSLVLPRSRMGAKLSESRGFVYERRELVNPMPRIGEVNERMADSLAESISTDVDGGANSGIPGDRSATLTAEPYLRRGGFRESDDGVLEPVKLPTYQDFLEARLKQRAEEAYENGLGYSRIYDPLEMTKSADALIRSRNYFEMYRDVERDQAKPYFAIGIVSFLNKDYSRAYSSMRDGILRVHTAEDLKIEKDRFFKDSSCYRELFDSASTFCSAMNDKAFTAVVLSYTAFLYGDMGTALSSVDAMKSISDPELVEAADRYRAALIEAGAGSGEQTPKLEASSQPKP